jgi:hypothetical protein
MEEIINLMDKIPGYIFYITFEQFCVDMYDKEFIKLKRHEVTYIEDKFELLQQNFIKFYSGLDKNNRMKFIQNVNNYKMLEYLDKNNITNKVEDEEEEEEDEDEEEEDVDEKEEDEKEEDDEEEEEEDEEEVDLFDLIIKNNAEKLEKELNKNPTRINEKMKRNTLGFKLFREEETTLLILAVYLKNKEIVEIILERMESINKLYSDKGGSAINYAIRNRDIEMAILLTRYNAVELDNTREDTGDSGLIELVRNNDLGMYEILRVYINDVNEENYKGQTALMIACMKGHVEMVRKLLFDCARTGYYCTQEKTVMDYAKMGGNAKIIKIIERSRL